MTNDSSFSGAPAGSSRRLLMILGAAVVVIAAALWFRGGGRAPTPTETASKTSEAEPGGKPDELELSAESQERIGLAAVEAQVRPLSAQIRTTGVVGPNETRMAHIRALSTGVITRVMVRKGDRVNAGQPLLIYDNVELGQTEAEFRSAVAALEKAQGEAEVTRLALERADRLVEIGGIAQGEHQRRKAEHAAAIGNVRTFEAQLANLRQKLARFGMTQTATNEPPPGGGAGSTLRAPFAGVVLDVQAVAGETVSPERELATVADLSTVWVQGDVYERDLAAIEDGRVVRLLADAYPNEPFTGRITYISDALDPATRTAKVRCEVKNPGGRLRLAMFVRIEIPAGAARETLVIPRESIQQIDGEPSVFVRTGDTSFERRSVTLGVTTDQWAEVVAGVRRGERVVTTGAVMLKSRLKVSEFAESEENDKK